ncbi:glycosyltransferase family 4 protein [Patescibacteria group bacterium]|nr:glycosyltransferase family 4 protein [Patescibacteria group bacterium]MBP9709677.1 glycosyltransferase family 4 protein [Patescibacteria group bacterium]
MTIVMLGQKGLPARSGGIERHVSLLSSGLAARGHRVVVYGRQWYAKEGVKQDGNLEQRFSKGLTTKHLDAITHGCTALWDARQLNPDILHIHGAGTALLLPLARLLHPHAKIITTFHCIDWEHAKWGPVARFAFRLGEWLMGRHSDRVITVSEALTRYCLRSYNVQTEYIAHPFTLPSTPLQAEEIVNSFKLAPERYLLSVSRLVAHKQPHLLITAYREALQRFPALFANIPLVIVGSGSWTDGYVRQLEALAATTPGVQLLGEQTGASLASLQALALAHVFPSRSEGLAFTTLEAGGYGRLAIMSDIPANREASGGSALFIPVGDEEALIQALIQAASMTASERRYLGQGFAAHVKTQYNFTERVDEMIRVYREVLHGQGTLTTPLPLAEHMLRP